MCSSFNKIRSIGDSGWEPIVDTPAGAQVVIRRISEMVEDDPELLHYCAEKGLKPGAIASVREVSPDGVILLDVDGETIAVGDRLSKHVFAERA